MPPHDAAKVYVFAGAPAADRRAGPVLVFPPDFPEERCLQGIPGDDPALGELGPLAEYTAIPGLDREPIGFYAFPPEAPPPPGWKFLEPRAILPAVFTRSLDGNLGRLLRAWHIFQWRRESRFCGSCGHRNGDAPGEAARVCPACGRMEYPRISPAVIVVITNEKDEILLAHNRNFRSGIYSLVAGFAEAGEDLESALAREVREEVSIEVEDIRYVCSQPWPFPNSLMAGFTARHKSGVIRPDGVEIEDARWFRREELPALPGNGSVSRYLINRWKEGERQGSPPAPFPYLPPGE